MNSLRLRNPEEPLRRLTGRRSFRCEFPRDQSSLSNAVTENGFDKVRSYFRSKLKNWVLYYLINEEK
jgi:hypothetical protein